MEQNIIQIASNFKYSGKIVSYKPLGEGHINKTYLVITDKNKYTLQMINTHVFTDPVGLMENIYNVTEFLKIKIIRNGGDPLRETLTVVKTNNDEYIYIDDSGNTWRSYLYIDNVITCQEPTSFQLVYDTGHAFGTFQNMLYDYEADKLNETIKDFHNTVQRIKNLEEAVKKNSSGRAEQVQEEIDFVISRKKDCSLIVEKINNGKIPLRVTHNDTKLNNVLFDKETNRPICILDLDTVMPGSILYDFGDALRIIGSSAVEDEKDLSKVHFLIDNFRIFTKGYLDSIGRNITEEEVALLAFSVKLITLEIGMRFLTDHINGDIYFGIHREGHNLDRARTQFNLVREIEENMDLMISIVDKIHKGQQVNL
ncbi:MAG: aminoglycoside phosphotransferase family protein [Clostridia bacterium]